MNLKQFNELIQSGERSIVILSASWCAPCKVLSRTIQEIKRDNIDIGAKVHYLDIENCDDIVTELNVSSVPTVVYIGNKTTIVKSGVASKSQLCDWFD